jgi:light-regulated signal transduction histidine kinase (bacteriophytochrome)
MRLDDGALPRINFLEGPWWPDHKVEQRVRDAFRRACGLTPVSYEEQLFAFGKVMTVSLSLVPVKAPDGTLAYVVVEARDITRRIEVEDALKAANHELEAFTYSVSHDLRAPIRHIEGFSRLLAEQLGSTADPTASHYLRRIEESTRHMGRLVDDLLHLARVGRQDVRPRPVALNALVSEVLPDIQSDAGTRAIEWKVGALPTVECDPGLLKIVFTNLLANAVKYTRPRECAVIEVAQTSRDGRPVVLVRDNGVGFDMKYADKLFGVFQRLHTADEFEGTGVGLATVQRIVHKHAGEIWAQAEPGRGATFYFTLGRPFAPAVVENP